MQKIESYSKGLWRHFLKHRLGVVGLIVVCLFALVGIYAPFLASSKPLVVQYDGVWYFPLFRYLFFTGFFTKKLDIFFNLLMFTFPLMLLLRRHKLWVWGLITLQCALFFFFILKTPRDPAVDVRLNAQRQEALRTAPEPSWDFDLKYMTPYARLNLLTRERNWMKQDASLQKYAASFTAAGQTLPTLWQEQLKREKTAAAQSYVQARRAWIMEEIPKLHAVLMPPLSHFHWEDDAGGSSALNQLLPWWKLTRTNHKDLMAALLFGVRISLVVGLVAVAISLLIGIPVGAYAGYYGGTFDIFVSRLLEVWEGMPTFFMLLLVVAILQSKSIFIVILVIGLFGWTGFSRYIRGEFFKQRNLPYVEACHALGFQAPYIMFSHILPNAIPPLLTLLPFAIMGAITSEAGLSFLGLGDEGSCSWGVLMDEGRTAFPAESYLLWPPAIALTLLLIAIALVGDALRDTLDPRTR